MVWKMEIFAILNFFCILLSFTGPLSIVWYTGFEWYCRFGYCKNTFTNKTLVDFEGLLEKFKIFFFSLLLFFDIAYWRPENWKKLLVFWSFFEKCFSFFISNIRPHVFNFPGLRRLNLKIFTKSKQCWKEDPIDLTEYQQQLSISFQN